MTWAMFRHHESKGEENLKTSSRVLSAPLEEKFKKDLWTPFLFFCTSEWVGAQKGLVE